MTSLHLPLLLQTVAMVMTFAPCDATYGHSLGAMMLGAPFRPVPFLVHPMSGFGRRGGKSFRTRITSYHRSGPVSHHKTYRSHAHMGGDYPMGGVSLHSGSHSMGGAYAKEASYAKQGAYAMGGALGMGGGYSGRSHSMGGAYSGRVHSMGGAYSGGVHSMGGAYSGGVHSMGGAYSGGVHSMGGAYPGGVHSMGGAYSGGVHSMGGAYGGSGLAHGLAPLHHVRSMGGHHSLAHRGHGGLMAARALMNFHGPRALPMMHVG